jgi:hypothetical protein
MNPRINHEVARRHLSPQILPNEQRNGSTLSLPILLASVESIKRITGQKWCVKDWSAAGGSGKITSIERARVYFAFLCKFGEGSRLSINDCYIPFLIRKLATLVHFGPCLKRSPKIHLNIKHFFLETLKYKTFFW